MTLILSITVPFNRESRRDVRRSCHGGDIEMVVGSDPKFSLPFFRESVELPRGGLGFIAFDVVLCAVCVASGTDTSYRFWRVHALGVSYGSPMVLLTVFGVIMA